MKEKIIQHDKNWEDNIKKNQLLIKNHNGYIRAFGLWVFRFFNYKISPSVLNRFEECFRKNDLNIDSENIKRAIKDRKLLRNLKGCYGILGRYLRNDFNNTSLVLYHGPVGSSKSESSILCFCPCCFCNFYVWSHEFFEDISNGFGQLLTGDINLNMNYNELIKHYTGYLKSVFIAQVPHHGARKNWNRNIIKDAPNSKFWIISAGIKNKYKHPSYGVIEEICLNGRKCFWINELNHIRVRGRIIW